MLFRNMHYNQFGSIDMEVEHPQYGWIPFTADPNDVEQHGQELYAAAIENGEIAEYVPPSPEQMRAALPDLTRKQFRLGMRNLGISTAMINSAIEAIPDNDAREIAQIEWEDSAMYSRTHPLVVQLITVFNKSADDVDNEWKQAVNYN